MWRVCLADDSGLEVDALGGAPAFILPVLQVNRPRIGEITKLLLEKLADCPIEQRGAQFRCVMALAAPDGQVEFSEGICRGVILFEPRGNSGFGYDPLFFVPELGLAFAELSSAEKNSISHRFRAMQGMLKVIMGLEAEKSS